MRAADSIKRVYAHSVGSEIIYKNPTGSIAANLLAAPPEFIRPSMQYQPHDFSSYTHTNEPGRKEGKEEGEKDFHFHQPSL